MYPIHLKKKRSFNESQCVNLIWAWIQTNNKPLIIPETIKNLKTDHIFDRCMGVHHSILLYFCICILNLPLLKKSSQEQALLVGKAWRACPGQDTPPQASATRPHHHADFEHRQGQEPRFYFFIFSMMKTWTRQHWPVPHGTGPKRAAGRR